MTPRARSARGVMHVWNGAAQRSAVSRRTIHLVLERLSVRSREPQLRPIVQIHDAITREPRLHLADAIPVHEKPPVNADEALLVETLRPRADGAAHDVTALADVNAKIIPVRFDPIHVADRHELRLPLALDRDSVQRGRSRVTVRLRIVDDHR